MSYESKRSFEYVKVRVTIEDLLAWYGNEEVVRSYGWTSLHCPFHDDHSPSARANAAHDRFDCFVCDIHGDIFDVVQEVEGFPDVLDAKEWIVANFLDS